MRLSYVMLSVVVLGCGGGGGDSGLPTGNSGGNNNPGGGNAGGSGATATASVTATHTDDGYGGDAVFSFSPASVTITRGGTVSWTASGAIAHNVTFQTAGSPANVGNFTVSSGTQSRQFNTAGTYSYQCTNHSGMNGSVKVE